MYHVRTGAACPRSPTPARRRAEHRIVPKHNACMQARAAARMAEQRTPETKLRGRKMMGWDGGKSSAPLLTVRAVRPVSRARSCETTPRRVWGPARGGQPDTAPHAGFSWYGNRFVRRREERGRRVLPTTRSDAGDGPGGRRQQNSVVSYAQRVLAFQKNKREAPDRTGPCPRSGDL